jgi:F420H(2)-dependent quinone reductase
VVEIACSKGGIIVKLYDRLIEKLAPTKAGGRIFLTLATWVDRRLLPLTGGRISSGFGSRFGKNILLLTTTGSKSGLKRTVPLLFTPYKEQIVLIASRGGDPKNPAWYNNLRKNPEVEVTIAGKIRKFRAEQVEGELREELWEHANRIYPGYNAYQSRVSRTIPVILLTEIV